MKSNLRIKKILFPAIVGLLINIVYIILINYLVIPLINTYFMRYVTRLETFSTNLGTFLFISGTIVAILTGMITYYICLRKEGTVAERFVSGIFFPFIFGFVFITVITVNMIFYPSSYLIGLIDSKNALEFLFRAIGNSFIGILKILSGSLIMHFIIIKRQLIYMNN